MTKEEILDIINNTEHKSNKTLINTRNLLSDEYKKTKDLIIQLTYHLEIVEQYYNKINREIEKRLE
jgi:hypothetical protein